MATENSNAEIACLDPLSDAGRISRQLHSLLCSLYGSGFESFSELNGDHQESILWLASDMAGALEKLIGKISLRTPEVSHG